LQGNGAEITKKIDLESAMVRWDSQPHQFNPARILARVVKAARSRTNDQLSPTHENDPRHGQAKKFITISRDTTELGLPFQAGGFG